MTELEKMQAGLEYSFADQQLVDRKTRAIAMCEEYNAIDGRDYDAQYNYLKKMLGGVGERVWIAKTFNCDCGKNIFIGNDFTGNFNLTILDIHEVRIGNNVMIGPNTLITTVGHPLSPMARRNYGAKAQPVTIGNDVWIGGNVTILPGITIGNNVVVAAGAVVTKDVPDNTLVAGVPARKLKDLLNDVDERNKFVFFWHEYPHEPIQKSCLSQWYDCYFYVSGVKYFTAEQYMMASKALLFNDLEVYEQILKAQTPHEFKKLGQQVKNFDKDIWDANKDRIVIEGNFAKFSQNPALGEFLLSTGDKILVEASPLDKIWGIGLSEDDKRASYPEQWLGENHLGNALMKVRALLKSNRDLQ